MLPAFELFVRLEGNPPDPNRDRPTAVDHDQLSSDIRDADQIYIRVDHVYQGTAYLVAAYLLQLGHRVTLIDCGCHHVEKEEFSRRNNVGWIACACGADALPSLMK